MSAGNNEMPDLLFESDEYRLNWRRLSGALALSLVLHLSLAGSIYHLLELRVQRPVDYVLSLEIVRAEQVEATESQTQVSEIAKPQPADTRPVTPASEPPPVKQKPIAKKIHIKQKPIAKKIQKMISARTAPVAHAKVEREMPAAEKEVMKPSETVLASLPEKVPSQQVADSLAAAALSRRVQSVRPVYAPRPAYPKPARRLGLEGRVVLGLWVSADGVPDVIVVKKSSGHKSLDESAKAGVLKWRFNVQDDGSNQASRWVELPVTFRLE